MFSAIVTAIGKHGEMAVAVESDAGSDRAVRKRTMNVRGSNLDCLRREAAAGSLLDYWTDFGRFFTKLP
jgi:hypothetical protein